MSETDNTKEDPLFPDGTVEEVNITVPFADSWVYSNVSALSTSMMDVRISFGEAMPDRTVRPRMGIAMPAEHAAILALNLLQQLNFFERNFGEIRNPVWRSFQEKAKQNMLRAQAQAHETDQPPPE